MGVAWLGGVGSVVGLVVGIIALGRVTAGRASGRGMALAGIAASTATLALSGVIFAGLYPLDQAPNAARHSENAPPLPVAVDPSSPYPVYGSSDLVKYLGQQMIKHEDMIDLRAYKLSTDAQAIEAALEAVLQNPYVMDVRTYQCGTQGCLIVYGYSAAEQTVLQRQVLEAVTSVLAETIDESMSDVQKVTALNNWLVDHAHYDDAAAEMFEALPENAKDIPPEYRYAWNAAGVLLDGLGVCESYAEAFFLLANAAGVPTVVVSGELLAGSSPHAWNKVYVGGQWKAVDVTWNDGPTTTTAYLMINDNQFTGAAARKQNSLWMADHLISSYNTPE